jgi:PAS domain S-box-containing protein
MEALRNLFSSADLTPHGFCLLWREDLLLLNTVSDAAIGLSYYVIPVALTYFVLKRRDVAFGLLFWMFAAFILACGTTHLVEIWTIWHPAYGLQGAVKFVTAIASVATAFAMWRLMPQALALPSPSQYLQVRTALSSEIEQRQQVSEALAETEQRHKLLIDSVTDYAIISLDLHGIITEWNRGAERIKGYRADEVIGHHFSMFYTPEDRDLGLPLNSLEEAERAGHYESEGLRVRKDGTQFLANIVIQPIYDRCRKHIGFAKITRDITQRRELEERLRQSQKMEAIGQLTGGVAHDFNNHLTVIFANLELAQQRMTNRARLAQALKSAIQGAERAASLTAQLLAFARRQPLNPEAIDIARLLARTSTLLDRVLGERITIETIRSGGLWPARCDAAQLEAALLNLAVNARDAMPDGGRMTLEVANAYLDDDYAAGNPDVQPGPYVMVAVTDTGVGMSLEVMQHAFDPFFTTKAEGQGTGLGLSQVFGFVKQSGGHVKLYSELGQGTTVKLYLPKASAENATVVRGPGDDHTPRGSGETVLVVEDDEQVRNAAAAMITDLGYSVVCAEGPEQALRVLAERAVNLVFTDVVMPGAITARELADQTRELQPGVKVLFTSGYTQNAVVHGGRLDDGVELISKPYRRDQLARRLRRLLIMPPNDATDETDPERPPLA